MSTVFLVPDDPTYDAIGFDVSPVETHTSVVTLTENPIEDGSTITDHIVISPREFSCTVGTSETPLDPTFFGDGKFQPVDVSVPDFDQRGPLLRPPAPPMRKQVLGFVVGREANLVREMFDRLTALQVNAVTMTVITSVREYPKMILVDGGLPRGPNSLGLGSFTLRFKELRVVQSKNVNAPTPKEPRGAPGQAKGPNAGDPLDKAINTISSKLDGLLGTGNESIYYKLLHGGGP